MRTRQLDGDAPSPLCTSAAQQDRRLLRQQSAEVPGEAYDLVINGYEAGGAAHDPCGTERVCCRERFGLLDAFNSHTAHGGAAHRLVMLFGGLDNMHDVIAFPKAQRATNLMTGDTRAGRCQTSFTELRP